jgi:hypothetical protein
VKLTLSTIKLKICESFIESQVLEQGEEFALGDFSDDASALKGAVGKELLPSTSPLSSGASRKSPRQIPPPTIQKQSSLHTRNSTHNALPTFDMCIIW